MTDPAEREHWFPSRIEGDVRAGGRLRFRDRDGAAPPAAGEVPAYAPPHRLAVTSVRGAGTLVPVMLP